MQRWYLFELQELRPFVDFSFHRQQPDVHEELMHSLPCLQSQQSWEEDSFCRSCSLSNSLESSMGDKSTTMSAYRACLQTLFQTGAFATFLPVGGDQKKSRD
eukprot:scaffold963_cov103-Skeletonema_dohrnii-CCMP3373.AAC.4